MSQPEAPTKLAWNHNPTVRVIIQIFQLVLLGVLLLQLRVERGRTEKVMQKAFLTQHDLEEEIRELKGELATAKKRVIELEGQGKAKNAK